VAGAAGAEHPPAPQPELLHPAEPQDDVPHDDASHEDVSHELPQEDMQLDSQLVLQADSHELLQLDSQDVLQDETHVGAGSQLEEHDETQGSQLLTTGALQQLTGSQLLHELTTGAQLLHELMTGLQLLPHELTTVPHEEPQELE